jgi:hypothetical protein
MYNQQFLNNNSYQEPVNFVTSTSTIMGTPSGYVNAPIGFLNMPVAVSSQIPANIANEVNTFGFSYFTNIEYVSKRQTKFLLIGGCFTSSTLLIMGFIMLGIIKDYSQFYAPLLIIGFPLLFVCLSMLYYYGNVKNGNYPRIKCCFPSVDPVLLGVIPPNTPNCLSLYSTLINNPFYFVQINKPINVITN